MDKCNQVPELTCMQQLLIIFAAQTSLGLFSHLHYFVLSTLHFNVSFSFSFFLQAKSG